MPLPLVSLMLKSGLSLIHSSTSEKLKAEAWLSARENKLSIILGTRSSIFVPFRKLGLIVIDEEHDESYKQQSGLMYSARDLAVLRAKKLGCSLILELDYNPIFLLSIQQDL